MCSTIVNELRVAACGCERWLMAGDCVIQHMSEVEWWISQNKDHVKVRLKLNCMFYVTALEMKIMNHFADLNRIVQFKDSMSLTKVT